MIQTTLLEYIFPAIRISLVQAVLRGYYSSKLFIIVLSQKYITFLYTHTIKIFLVKLLTIYIVFLVFLNYCTLYCFSRVVLSSLRDSKWLRRPGRRCVEWEISFFTLLTTDFSNMLLLLDKILQ